MGVDKLSSLALPQKLVCQLSVPQGTACSITEILQQTMLYLSTDNQPSDAL